MGARRASRLAPAPRPTGGSRAQRGRARGPEGGQPGDGHGNVGAGGVADATCLATQRPQTGRPAYLDHWTLSSYGAHS